MFPLRNTIGLVAATVMTLTACGGRAIVPNAAPNAVSQTFDLTLRPKACYTAKVQPAWIFHGACVMTKLTAKGLTVKLPAYKGVSLTLSLPAQNSAGGKGGSFVVVDALGGSDVSKWKGKALPAVPARTGKSVLYVQAVNGIANLKFLKGNLVFVVTTKKSPGTSCALSLLQQSGTKFSWFKTPIVAKIKGGAATYTIPGVQLGILFAKGLPKGPLFFNDACK